MTRPLRCAPGTTGRKLIKSLRRVLAALPALFVAFSCSLAPDHERVQWIMGTYARIVVDHEDASAVDPAFHRLAEIDSELSLYKEDSPLSRVNAAAGRRPVPVPDRVADAVALSLRVSNETDGAFDPTLGALTLDAYGFGRNAAMSREIGPGLRDSVWGRDKVEVGHGVVFLTEKGMKLDLGGMGKGLALDEAAAVFDICGVATYLVALGGDYRTKGRGWNILIQDPRVERPLARFRTGEEETCVSTSGDYRRGFYSGGEWVHHLLDPRTGTPARGFRSVTLVGPPPCALIDAAATAVFVMGEGAGLRYLSMHQSWAYLLVTSEGRSIVRSDSPVRFHL